MTEYGFQAACCALVLALVSASQSLPAAQDGVSPATNSRSPSVSALGRIEPEHGIIRIAAPAMIGVSSGVVVSELKVREGEMVVAGQILAVTDLSPLFEAMVTEAEARLDLARREADALVSLAEGTCAQADARQREAVRRARWRESNVASEEEAEKAEAEALVAKAACTAAKAEITAAKSRVNVAASSLHRSQVDLDRSFIRAPSDGRIIDILARPGELITHRGAFELGRMDRMYAIAEVYETDVRLVRIGAPATVTSPALGSRLTGQVTHVRLKVQKQDEIGTDPAARKDARIVEVEILLDDPEPAAMFTNLQVTVEIGN